jgi:ABC-type Fe3+ transport system permease subunit
MRSRLISASVGIVVFLFLFFLLLPARCVESLQDASAKQSCTTRLGLHETIVQQGQGIYGPNGKQVPPAFGGSLAVTIAAALGAAAITGVILLIKDL